LPSRSEVVMPRRGFFRSGFHFADGLPARLHQRGLTADLG
jgi:hypothetical protein